jgi:hypothetical protein
LFTQIISNCTNINISSQTIYKIKFFETDKDDEQKEITSLEYLYYSGIWQKIKNEILDYEDLRQELEDVLRLVLKDKYSSKQLFNEITKFVDGFINSDKVKDLVSQLDQGKKELSKFYPNIKVDDEVLENKIIEESIESKPRKKKVKKF